MSDSGHMQAEPEYVDQVVRKERFLAQHPEVVIELDREAPPYEEWRGQVRGHKQITSAELGNLLDRLEEILAVGEAEGRWPGWRFTRVGSQWKAQEVAGTRVVFGPSLQAAEARVGHEERATRLHLPRPTGTDLLAWPARLLHSFPCSSLAGKL